MKVAGQHYRGIWRAPDGGVRGVDQSRLPFEFVTRELASVEDAAQAIQSMVVRGAPLIGATAAYGMALAARSGASPSERNSSSCGGGTAVSLSMAWAWPRWWIWC